MTYRKYILYPALVLSFFLIMWLNNRNMEIKCEIKCIENATKVLKVYAIMEAEQEEKFNSLLDRIYSATSYSKQETHDLP